MGTIKRSILLICLLVNAVIYFLHIQPPYDHYFCQLTSFGMILVILNFIWALTHNIEQPFSKSFSRFHIITFSIQTVVVIGFWSLRIFFTKGIIDENEKRDFYVQTLSLWVHGGAFITLFAIGKVCKLHLQFKLWIKILTHLCWAIPYILVQYGYFLHSGEHIYGFLKFFSLDMLIGFQSALYILSILSDYFLTFILEHKKVVQQQKSSKKHHSKSQ